MDVAVKESDLLQLIVAALTATGICSPNALAIARNVVAAERHGKRSHGLVSCILFDKYRDSWKKPAGEVDCSIGNPGRIRVGGGFNSGHLAMETALSFAIEHFESSNVECIVTEVSQFQASVGYAGEFGRQAAANGFGYLGFHNCHGGLHAEGVQDGVLGTNPFVIALPISDIELMVFDSSCAQKSWSAQYLDQLLTGVDDDHFSVGPWGGMKGIGLSTAIEILVSSLSGSKAFNLGVERGLGSAFFLFRLGSVNASPWESFAEFLSDRGEFSSQGSLRVPGRSNVDQSSQIEDRSIVVDKRLFGMVKAIVDRD